MNLQHATRPIRGGTTLRALALAAFALLAGGGAGAADFSFLQFSDTHSPVAGSREVIALARDAGPTRLAPYNVTAPAPSFALVTGDLTEFGAGDGAWERFRGYFDGYKIPIYEVPGNHDGTWWNLKPTLRALHGGFPYAFDHEGCHFIALDSAGRQDPRPGFGLEELSWLREHLKGIDKTTPLFLFFHHPLQGSEWASPYDYERLLEILGPYNVALMLVGHGHSARAFKFGDYDAVEGGSTFDQGAKPPSAGRAGYNIISIQDGVLRVAYRKAVEPEATQALLEKSLAPRPALPEPGFLAPGSGASVQGDRMHVELAFAGAPDATGDVALDSEKAVPLERDGDRWKAEIDISALTPGVRVLRAHFRQGERAALATREIVLARPDSPQALWRVFPGGSIHAALAVDGGRVYAGSQDGALYALDAANGRTLWRFATGGEILGRPAVAPEAVYVASTDGFLYGVSKEGKELWRCAAGAPLVAPPAWLGDVVALGAVDGTFHCVERATGKERWRSNAAKYSVEAAACLTPDTFYFGAWDTFVYALSAADGTLRWKAVGQGSSHLGAARYYSPADCAPALAAGRLFVADRAYEMAILDAATGERLGSLPKCGAVAPAPDGQSAFLRRYSTAEITRVDAEGKTVWACETLVGSLPAAPAEEGGLVAVCSNTGIVSAISAADGKLLWQYRAVPGFYVPGGAVPSGGRVYVAGLDGSVSCVEGGK